MSREPHGKSAGPPDSAAGRVSGLVVAFVTLLLSVLTLPACKPAPSARQNTDALIGAWSFEEEGGDAVLDRSGNENHGLARNAERVQGAVGRGLRFTGSESGVDIPDGPAFQLRGSFTIEAWVKPEELPPDIVGHNHGLIFFRGDSRVGLDPYTLTFTSDGALRFSVLNANDNYVEIDHPIALDEFSHVAGVLDATQKKVRLHVNGQLASETSTDVLPLVELDPTSEPAVGIGHHAGRMAWDYGFRGVIDEVKLHGRALSSEEIQSRVQAR